MQLEEAKKLLKVVKTGKVVRAGAHLDFILQLRAEIQKRSARLREILAQPLILERVLSAVHEVRMRALEKFEECVAPARAKLAALAAGRPPPSPTSALFAEGSFGVPWAGMALPTATITDSGSPSGVMDLAGADEVSSVEPDEVGPDEDSSVEPEPTSSGSDAGADPAMNPQAWKEGTDYDAVIAGHDGSFVAPLDPEERPSAGWAKSRQFGVSEFRRRASAAPELETVAEKDAPKVRDITSNPTSFTPVDLNRLATQMGAEEFVRAMSFDDVASLAVGEKLPPLFRLITNDPSKWASPDVMVAYLQVFLEVWEEAAKNRVVDSEFNVSVRSTTAERPGSPGWRGRPRELTFPEYAKEEMQYLGQIESDSGRRLLLPVIQGLERMRTLWLVTTSRLSCDHLFLPDAEKQQRREAGGCSQLRSLDQGSKGICWMMAARMVVLWMHLHNGVPLTPGVLTYFDKDVRSIPGLPYDHCPVIPPALRGVMMKGSVMCADSVLGASMSTVEQGGRPMCLVEAALKVALKDQPGAYDYIRLQMYIESARETKKREDIQQREHAHEPSERFSQPPKKAPPAFSAFVTTSRWVRSVS
ncbi:MAG TPA: hypothetical protein EYQ83_02880 [Acidobacteria bacterium]|nr:hypothetical protein [Acidobacteriota bacterium]